MTHRPTFNDYFNRVNLKKYLEDLGAQNIDAIVKGVEHFTKMEGESRDQIVLNYFGVNGVKLITESIVEHLLAPPKLKVDAKILDIGAGSGLFTINVANKVRRQIPMASFYAMDITPAMLSILASKTSDITPFIGIAENVSESVKHARKYVEIPNRFDAIFSTLTLHHCQEVGKIFRSIKNALKNDGKAVIIDLCEHPFKEFQEEMGDVDLGFNPSSIKEEAKSFFFKCSNGKDACNTL